MVESRVVVLHEAPTFVPLGVFTLIVTSGADEVLGTAEQLIPTSDEDDTAIFCTTLLLSTHTSNEVTVPLISGIPSFPIEPGVVARKGESSTPSTDSRPRFSSPAEGVTT